MGIVSRNKGIVLSVAGLVAAFGINFSTQLIRNQGYNAAIEKLEDAKEGAYENARYSNANAWSDHGRHFDYAAEYLRGNLKANETFQMRDKRLKKERLEEK